MDDKLIRLARKINALESKLNKIMQVENLESLLYTNVDITNKYKKSISDVVGTYKDYISEIQKELDKELKAFQKQNKELDILRKESKEIQSNDKQIKEDLNNKINKIKEDLAVISKGINISIEKIQKDILDRISKNTKEIDNNNNLKNKELSEIRKENLVLKNNIKNLKEMFDKLELQKGEAGKSAYEIACELGFKGTVEEWIKSLHGKDGKDLELRGMRAFSDAPNNR